MADLVGRPNRIRRRMQRRRRERRLLAVTGGYFWLPCPRCGIEFGGNEWVGRFTITTSVDVDANGVITSERSEGVCPACEADLGRMGAELCQRTGHDWKPTWRGREQSHTTSGRRHDVGFTFGGPPEVWCSNCGVDAPPDVAAQVVADYQ